MQEDGRSARETKRMLTVTGAVGDGAREGESAVSEMKPRQRSNSLLGAKWAHVHRGTPSKSQTVASRQSLSRGPPCTRLLARTRQALPSSLYTSDERTDFRECV